MKMNKFTAEDDKVIIRAINDHLNNINYACGIAAQETGRTRGSILNRYYSKIKNEHTLISTASSIGNMIRNNQKNAPLKYKAGLSEEEQYEIASELIRRMNPEKKKRIIKLLLGL